LLLSSLRARARVCVCVCVCKKYDNLHFAKQIVSEVNWLPFWKVCRIKKF